MQHWVVNLIIKGQNGKDYYLKDKENNESLNYNIDYTKHIYGERTGLLFEAFKNMIEFLENHYNLKFLNIIWF